MAFSPHAKENALLESVADDIGTKTTSSLFYSLAFLYQTPGVMQDAIKKVSKSKKIFVYGISDRKVGGLDLQKPDGNVSPVFPSALTKDNVPEPFKSEPTGGGGIRMHHKFVVIDFDKPTARVYLGSYNFSIAGGHQERREPASDPRPPDRGVVRHRGAADLRPLPFPGGSEGSEESAEEAAVGEAAPQAGREGLVGRGLHERPKDPRSRALRVK